MYRQKNDFGICEIMVGFPKYSHIWYVNQTCVIGYILYVCRYLPMHGSFLARSCTYIVTYVCYLLLLPDLTAHALS